MRPLGLVHRGPNAFAVEAVIDDFARQADADPRHTHRHGASQQSNFRDYEVLRASHAPPVQVRPFTPPRVQAAPRAWRPDAIPSIMLAIRGRIMLCRGPATGAGTRRWVWCAASPDLPPRRTAVHDLPHAGRPSAPSLCCRALPPDWKAAVSLAIRAFLGLLAALVPAGLVQIHLEREARQQRYEALSLQAQRQIDLVARHQVGLIASAQQSLAAMAALSPGAACDGFLDRLVQASPRYRQAWVLDESGTAICTSPTGSAAPPVTLKLGYLAGAAAGEGALLLVAPRPDGAPGQVALALSLDWLQGELRGLNLPAGSVTLLADPQGGLLARWPPDTSATSLGASLAASLGKPLPATLMPLLNARAPGFQSEGEARSTAFRPPGPGTGGLFIFTMLDGEAAALAAVQADRRAAAIIVSSLLLACLLALLGFHLAIERPLRRLLTAAQRWGREEWEARAGAIGGGSDFTRLAAAFDAMAEAVAGREAARFSAQTRMMAVQEVAPQIVLTADAAGRVDWTNPYWRQLTGQSLLSSQAGLNSQTGLSSQIGLSSQPGGWLEAIHPDDRLISAAAWRQAVAKVAPFEQEMRLRRAADGAWRWFQLRAAAVPGPDGGPRAWTIVGADVHALRETQAELAKLAAQLHATYENAPAGLCLLDDNLRFLAINDMLALAYGQPVEALLGRSLAEVAPLMAAMVEPAMRHVLATGEAVSDLQVSAGEGAQQRSWLCNYHPVRDQEGRVSSVSGAVIDITARRRFDQSERLLSREVDHRAQNALSVVRGLLRLSAADAPDDVPALVEVLEGRIAAMSRAHNVLSREKWVAADLRELVVQELAPHARATTLEGPPLRLVAEAAQPLTMVLHELVTNALKYGALSGHGGRITINWARQDSGAILHWTECGGPSLGGKPTRIGLGTMLIDANLRAQLAGRILRDWRPEGLACTLIFGAEALAGAAPQGPLPEDSALLGRRVLLALDDPAEGLALAAALREAGCEVIGPAETSDQAQALLEQTGAVDAAVLAGTLRGRSVQPLVQMLQRRTTAVVYLSEFGVAPEDLAKAVLLPTPVSARSLRSALAVALSRAQERARELV